MTTYLATVDTTGAINGTQFVCVDETRDEQVIDSPWSKSLTAEEIEDGDWDAILGAAGWTVVTGWVDHDGYSTAEVERTEVEYYADAAWGGRIGVFVTSTDEWLLDSDLPWVDPEDDSAEADDLRREVITDALAAIGWAPVPGAEWVHIEGGLPNRDGAERVPVRRVGA